MANVQIGYINIAESGTTTAVASDSDHPLHRLFDRYFTDVNWRTGSAAIKTTTGSDLVTNGGFTSTTTGWSTDDDCTLSSVAGGESGTNALTIAYDYTTTGSNFVTNGDFSSVLTPWAAGSSDYTASIVGSGYSGNAVNINNNTVGSSLVTNGTFDTTTTGWSASNSTLAIAAAGRSGNACEMTPIVKSSTTNLITNGKFESDTTGWTNSGTTMSRSTNSMFKGLASLQINCSPATDYVYQDISTEVGAVYRISCWVRRTTSGSAALTVRTTGGTVIKQGLEVAAGTSWKPISFFFTATETTTRVCLGLIAATFQYDEIEMYYVGTNLLTNPSFEDGTTGWTVGAGTTAVVNTSVAVSGNCLNLYSAIDVEHKISQTISGLTPGNYYQCYLHYRPVAYGYHYLYCHFDNNTDVYNGGMLSSFHDSFAPYNSWHYFKFLFCATSSSHTFVIRMTDEAGTANQYYIDECCVAQYYGNDYSFNFLTNDCGDMEAAAIATYTATEVAMGFQTNATQSRNTSYYIDGSYSYFMSTYTGNSKVRYSDPICTLKAGETVILHGNYRSSSSTQTIIIKFYKFGYWSTPIQTTSHSISTSFVAYDDSFTATENMYLGLEIELVDPGTTVGVYIDGLTLTKDFVNPTVPYMYQLISGMTPDTDYVFNCYFNNGSISSLGQACSIVARRGSNSSIWDYESYTISSSYLLATLTFTCPSDETSMYICFQKDVSASGSVYLDDFSAYTLSNAPTQYIQQTISGLTAEKRYKIDGYVLKPTIADASNYTIGAYRTDTEALIASSTGTATTSWVAFSSLAFDMPAGLTSIYLRLIRNSATTGDMRFDSVSMYRMLYSPNGQSAYQNITTVAGTKYRLTASVHDGIGAGALTTSPYEIAVYNGSTQIESDSGNTSSSWSAKTFDFTALGTTTKVVLKKDSSSNGNIAFDTVSVYQLLITYPDQWIHIDQGTTSKEVDTLVVPSGHVLTGLYCQLQYSTDDSIWTDAVTDWTQSGSSQIVKTMSSAQTKRYWRMYITAASSWGEAPELGEFYLTKMYTVVSQPKYNLTEAYVSNIKRLEADSWKTENIINSTYRRKIDYEFPYCSSTEKAVFEDLRDECLFKKPFFITDHQGDQYFVELLEDMIIEPITPDHYNIKIKLMEVL